MSFPELKSRIASPGNFYPSQADLASTPALERTFKDNYTKLYALQKSVPEQISTAIASVPKIIQDNVTTIQQTLQAGGASPLNLTGLLPPSAQGDAIVYVDTHANRLANYAPANYPIGTLFIESDRDYLYVVDTVAGVYSWVYVSGTFEAAFSARPSDLLSTDVGALFYATDTNVFYIWTGSVWLTIGGSKFTPSADSTTAFEVTKAAGTAVLTVDTTNGILTVVSKINATGSYEINGVVGLTQVVALAKLTSGGTNGTLTLTGGIPTAYTAPT